MKHCLSILVLLLVLVIEGRAQTWAEGDYQLNRKKSTAGFEVAELLAGSNITLTWDNTAKTVTIASSGGGGGGAGAWGSITGTLTDQTDLATALNAKISTATAATTYQPLDTDLTAWAAVNPSAYSDTATIAAAYQPLATVLTNTTASFTSALETKLNGIATGAEVNVHADWSAGSGDAQILNKPTLGTMAAETATDYLTTAAAASTYPNVTITDTDTFDFGLTGQALTGSVRTQMSITSDASGLKLSGDASTPGNSKYWGTNGSGTKGFYDLPSGGSSSPGGSDTHVQFNDGGAFGGEADFNYDKTSNTLYVGGSISSGTVTATTLVGVGGTTGPSDFGPVELIPGKAKFGWIDGSFSTWYATIQPPALSADISLTLPSSTGTIALLSDITGGVSDGDKGDIVVSSSGTVYSIDSGVLTTAARTVTDDATVGDMVNTLGGATSTGTGGLARATSPTFVTPILGTPTSATLTNATGLPIATGVSGLGTGIATALAINTGSAGAPVLFNGALGTPSSGTMTNVSGTAASLTAGQATAALGLKTATTTVVIDSATAPTSGQVLTATSSTAANWQTPSGGGGGAGTKTIAVYAPRDHQPTASNFATLDTRNAVSVLDFDGGSTNEESVFVGVIPEAAVLTSGIKVRIKWAASTATSGDCRWGAQWEREGTDIDSDSFDTATEAHSTTSGTSGIETTTEITCTSIDSLAAGERYRLKIYRDASDTTNDTMTGDAELIAVEVRTAN